MPIYDRIAFKGGIIEDDRQVFTTGLDDEVYDNIRPVLVYAPENSYAFVVLEDGRIMCGRPSPAGEFNNLEVLTWDMAVYPPNTIAEHIPEMIRKVAEYHRELYKRNR